MGKLGNSWMEKMKTKRKNNRKRINTRRNQRLRSLNSNMKKARNNKKYGNMRNARLGTNRAPPTKNNKRNVLGSVPTMKPPPPPGKRMSKYVCKSKKGRYLGGEDAFGMCVLPTKQGSTKKPIHRSELPISRRNNGGGKRRTKRRRRRRRTRRRRRSSSNIFKFLGL